MVLSALADGDQDMPAADTSLNHGDCDGNPQVSVDVESGGELEGDSLPSDLSDPEDNVEESSTKSSSPRPSGEISGNEEEYADSVSSSEGGPPFEADDVDPEEVDPEEVDRPQQPPSESGHRPATLDFCSEEPESHKSPYPLGFHWTPSHRQAKPSPEMGLREPRDERSCLCSTLLLPDEAVMLLVPS